ncbi:PPT3 [Symbiodinium microadriaticum]|nr:PPT3 [Symbiodinium microadriaticum]
MVANLLNSMSMMCSGITLTYVVKSLIPFFTVLCCRFRGQHFGLEIYASLLPICMGVSLASATDVDCSLIGLLCALGSSLAQTLLNITSKERIESLKLSGMEAFTVMATICAGLSVPLLWLSYSQDTGNGILSAILSPTDGMPLLALQIVSMAAFAYHVEYTLNFLFVALCTPLAFSVTDIVRRLGTICCGAILFSKPMTMLNVLGVVVSLTGVAAYTTVSKRAAARARSESKEWSAQYSALRDGGSEDREKQPDLNRMGDSSISLGLSECEENGPTTWWWQVTDDSSLGIAPQALCPLTVWTIPERRTSRFGRFFSDSGSLPERYGQTYSLRLRRCLSADTSAPGAPRLT